MIKPSLRAQSVQFSLCITGGAFLIWTLWSIYNTTQNSHGAQRVQNSYNAVRNDTLGFEKVFAINLPSRPDKKDNIILGSSVSGFHVDWIEGVAPEDISTKSLPYNWNHAHLLTEYARRRAHLNVIQRVIENRLSSAIIMEDDTDWDILIKTQLQNFAVALGGLQGSPDTETASPYGDDWDILWLGHCGVQCKTQEPSHLTPNDPTVPASRHFLPYLRESPPIERPEHARLTCTARDIACGSFYAVSYRGAQKILAALSVSPLGLAEEIDIGGQIDLSLGRLCGHGYLQCYATYPAITGKYRAAGVAGKASDVHNGTRKASGFATWGVMYSVMLNIQRLVTEDTTVRATWQDVPVPEISLGEVEIQEEKARVQEIATHQGFLSYSANENRREEI
ncbi:CAZyme family GT25 [Penicillium angulare]|uniref:CAZyme family GT25 n=1 Tax=Penicillium angulare TaxID=116970 RepID=UPI002541564D|nr:CAZyme family GT25 [Penicillium angulare]KAJ5288528.1 CAZyme family GT25 [Penicillium angulare]